MRTNKFGITLLLLIMLVGVALRSVEVLNKNFLFGIDQGRDYLAVEKIVKEGKLTLIGPEIGAGFASLNGVFHGPYYFYSLVLPFLIWGGNPYGGLVLMFFFGVSSLLLFFFMANKIFGFKVAMVATFLFSLSPLITSQSRFMWNSHPSTFFILLAFWFTYKMIDGRGKYFFLATFFAGVIYGFEIGISIPLVISQFLFAILFLKIKDIRFYLSGVLGVAIAHLPFFLFDIRHNFMQMRGILGSLFSSLTKQGSIDSASLFADHLVNFWHNFRNTFVLSWIFPLLLLVLMLYVLHEAKRRKISLPEVPFVNFLLILPVVSFVIFLFLKTAVWDFYLIQLHIAYILLFAYFSLIRITKIRILFIALLILMIPGLFKELRRAYVDYYDFGGTAKIKGKIEAIDYLYKEAGGNKFNVLVFTPPVYDYAYQYLFNWYGQKKYGYTPGHERGGELYLLIEPESSGLWHKGWLETVIGPGEVIKEEKLPSGFIVQKRYDKKP